MSLIDRLFRADPLSAERRALETMSDHQLADLGITRDQIELYLDGRAGPLAPRGEDRPMPSRAGDWWAAPRPHRPRLRLV